MSLATYPYRDTIHRCFRCGYCKFPQDWSDVTNCPAYARYRMESYSSGGRLWLIRAWVEGEIPWSEHLANIVFACAACKNCVEKCPLSFRDEIVNMVIAAKSEMVELGQLPKTVKTYLQNVQLHGNPYGLPAKRRQEWMADLDLPAYAGQPYLLYVGCEGAYDTRAQEAARALARVMTRAGVSFGVLGNDEVADGNDVAMLGEDGLAETLAEKNIARFQERGVQTIVTFSPHAFNAFKQIYPRHGGVFEVKHYTQLLADLLVKKQLKSTAEKKAKVTFHDPCLLGRWNGEYKAPRKILQQLPGVELVEMERNRKSALCCGGGAGNYAIDLLGGSEESPARLRAGQAQETGAAILATACPNCLTMLEDAIKVEGLDTSLRVMDLCEIVEEFIE